MYAFRLKSIDFALIVYELKSCFVVLIDPLLSMPIFS